MEPYAGRLAVAAAVCMALAAAYCKHCNPPPDCGDDETL